MEKLFENKEPMTLGSRIAYYRKLKGLTQDDLAEKFGISAQAVSKWENDITCPDIMIIPNLAELFGITTDELLTGKKVPETAYLTVSERKDPDEMLFKIRVKSHDGDKVNVNIPVALARIALESNLLPDVNGMKALKDIDIKKILSLVDVGVVGKLIEVESADDDIVEVYVE